jgi:F-type H+-transporting ATPase subunit b
MVALLNATLLKPINRILEERDRRTKGTLSEAAAKLAVSEQKMREYEGLLRQARADGYALSEHERAGLSLERDRQLAEVKTEIANRLADEQAKIKNDAAQVKNTLEADAQTMALQISRQILQREITELPKK